MLEAAEALGKPRSNGDFGARGDWENELLREAKGGRPPETVDDGLREMTVRSEETAETALNESL